MDEVKSFRPLTPNSNSNDSESLATSSIGNDSTFIDSSVCDEPLITSNMVLEEKKIAKEAEEEEERLRQEYLEKMKRVEKEQRYKRLMHLLNKSQFYSGFLNKKLEEAVAKEASLQKKVDMKKKQQESLQQREENSATGKPLGEISSNKNNDSVNDGENSDTKKSVKMRKNRKRKLEAIYDYDIKEVISKETIENVKLAQLESNSSKHNAVSCHVGNDKENGDDGGGRTKVTGLGFVVPEEQPNLLEGGVLRDYQLQGVEWLRLLFENGMNGILADEMGLGKTIQVIGHLCLLIERGIAGPFLIVAPLSTLSNWIMEFEKFAPQLPVILFHGSKQERTHLYHSLNRETTCGEKLRVKPVVVTSYEVPMKEAAVLSRIHWQFIIVDEGHRIKNAYSLLSRVLRTFHSNNRLLLTGTPLQNNLTELWSLLNFLLPELFDDYLTFEAWFDLQELENAEGAEKIIQQECEQQVLSTLHQILCPFLLRRMKCDIVLNIPPKKEVMVYCPMTPLQMEMYESVVNKSIAEIVETKEMAVSPRRRTSSVYRSVPSSPGSPLSQKIKNVNLNDNDYFHLDNMPVSKEFTKQLGGVGSPSRPNFINRIKMQVPPVTLKHIVNHPYLVRMPVVYNEKGDKLLKVTQHLKETSGKMLVLDAMLTKLKERGHKVLIFCTSTMMLDLIEDYVILENYQYVRLDGRSKLLDRKADIYKFNTDPETFLFLISTKAGGLGINLVGADTVILYNSDWNPQIDLQAQDRAHRIGQTRPVVVYRFNVAGTIDEKVINRASSKRKLEKLIMKKGAFTLSSGQKETLFDLQELRELLKNTDTNKQMQPNGFIFSDEELEELLDRSDLIEMYKNTMKNNASLNNNKHISTLKKKKKKVKSDNARENVVEDRTEKVTDVKMKIENDINEENVEVATKKVYKILKYDNSL